MISKISKETSIRLCTYIEQVEKISVVQYGLEVLIRTFLKLVGIIILCWVTGEFRTILIVVTTLSLFRIISGGFHFKSYIPCYISSMSMILGTAILSSFLAQLLSEQTVLGIILFSSVLSILIIMVVGPVINPDRVKANNRKTYFKNISLILIIVYTFISFFFLYTAHTKYSLSISIVLIIQSLTLISKEN